MRIIYIITGANGFLGNNIIRQLSDESCEIRALILPGESTAALKGLNCSIYEGDITDLQSLRDLFNVEAGAKVYVIHCAGLVYIKTKYNPAVQRVNVDGTKNIAEMCLETGAKLVYVNSVHAIAEPPEDVIIAESDCLDPERVIGLYAKTKAEAGAYILEKVRQGGLCGCIVQPSGMIGPYDFGSSHLTQMVLDFLEGRLKACVRGGYDFVDVRDVADGAIKACKFGRSGQCYILSNQFFTIRDFLNQIAEISGKKKISLVLPMGLAKVTAPLSEIYYKLLRQPPLYTRYSLYTLTAKSSFSNEKARRELHYCNRPMEETITDTVCWLMANKRLTIGK